MRARETGINLSERALRLLTVRRKNWLFAGSPRGARAAAILYTIIESARRNGTGALQTAVTTPDP